MDKFYTYILICSDNSFYIGWTTDINKRIEKHNKGKGAKYTKGRRPVSLLKYWSWDSRSEAMKYEYALKQLSREEKEKLTGWKN
jgi:putative endonuclease